jgi:signal transduction histidine kinase
MASVIGLPLTLAVFTRQKSDSWLIGAIIFSALAFGLRWFLTVYTLLPVSDSMANLLIFRLIFGMCFVSATLWLIDRELKNQLQASIMSEAVARQQAKSETLRRETQERFMTMLMHEIKTPLAIIQFAASSLGRQFKHASAEATRVKNINRSVDDLNALMERCVSADQFDQGAMEMHKVSLCLAMLTTDVVQNLDAGRIALTGSAHLTVFSDATYLRLILLNLLSNALKYSPPDSLVEFSIASMEQDNKTGVNLQVTNAVGVAGVPDAQQVFARYYRAEGARREIGAGLGLWLSHALARQLGSELKFQASTERVSFSFFLELA